MDNKPNQLVKHSVLIEAKTGSIAAFEKLLSAYEKKIFNYISSIVGQRQDAEDLTQETFIKLYKKLKSIDPDSNFNAWLYTIATNAARDWFRKKKNELFIINEPDSGFETIDEDFSYNKIETAKDLENALNSLKPVYRAVLLLFYRQGFSYEEIASMLSVPVNTVKTHLYRAKKALRDALLGKSD